MSAFVQCVRRVASALPEERILAIGGVSKDGRWSRSLEDAIADIRADARSYYVLDPRSSKTIWVVLGVTDDQKLYLSAGDDGDTQRTLLSLTDCARPSRIIRLS